MLVPADSRTETVSGAAFEEGVTRFNDFPQTQVLHRLFECRSRMLNGELARAARQRFCPGF